MDSALELCDWRAANWWAVDGGAGGGGGGAGCAALDAGPDPPRVLQLLHAQRESLEQVRLLRGAAGRRDEPTACLLAAALLRLGDAAEALAALARYSASAAARSDRLRFLAFSAEEAALNARGLEDSDEAIRAVVRKTMAEGRAELAGDCLLLLERASLCGPQFPSTFAGTGDGFAVLFNPRLSLRETEAGGAARPLAAWCASRVRRVLEARAPGPSGAFSPLVVAAARSRCRAAGPSLGIPLDICPPAHVLAYLLAALVQARRRQRRGAPPEAATAAASEKLSQPDDSVEIMEAERRVGDGATVASSARAGGGAGGGDGACAGSAAPGSGAHGAPSPIAKAALFSQEMGRQVLALVTPLSDWMPAGAAPGDAGEAGDAADPLAAAEAAWRVPVREGERKVWAGNLYWTQEALKLCPFVEPFWWQLAAAYAQNDFNYQAKIATKIADALSGD